jgi:ABC-type transporter Mla MlaB component
MDLPAVDCWIGVVQERDRRVVTLAGRLGEEQVPVLLQVCGHAGALHLDLSDLMAADAAGVEALRRMRARGALLVSVPGYIRMKLESPFTGMSLPPPAC